MRILEDSPAVRVLEDRGRRLGGIDKAVEIAINMLNDGDDYSRISRITGLDSDRIAEIDKERQVRV